MKDEKLQELLDYIASGEPLRPGTELYDVMVGYSAKARRATSMINAPAQSDKEILRFMAELTGGDMPPGFRLFPPIYSDFGKNLHFGRDVFVNSCCCFQDQGGIYIGDNCLIGHQVVFATINHGLAASDRHTNYCKPVRLGANVWVGAGAKILPGVTIGDNAVIAAGAVVNKDIPANSIAVGVPAKVTRQIPED